jgi:hypothetical protein
VRPMFCGDQVNANLPRDGTSCEPSGSDLRASLWKRPRAAGKGSCSVTVLPPTKTGGLHPSDDILGEPQMTIYQPRVGTIVPTRQNPARTGQWSHPSYEPNMKSPAGRLNARLVPAIWVGQAGFVHTGRNRVEGLPYRNGSQRRASAPRKAGALDSAEIRFFLPG